MKIGLEGVAMDKGYKVIRVITVAPVLALIITVIVAGNCEGIFPSPWHFYTFN